MSAAKSADAGWETAHYRGDQQVNACDFAICPECGGAIQLTVVVPRSSSHQPL